MSPWERGGPPPPKAPRGGGPVLLALVLALAALMGLLFKAFPGEVRSFDDWGSVVGGLGLVALVSAGVVRSRRIDWGQTARHAAIWVAILAILVLAVTYRDELAGVGQRVRSEFSGAYPVATGGQELVVTADEGGGFFVMGKVNGQLVRFLVDTGASETVLSPADARRIGVNVDALHFDQQAETANGIGYGAAFKADSVAVGPIRFDNVPLQVNQAQMTSSLLGMTFLGRLESFHVSGRKLYLKARP